jgi:hypothetical protein
MPYRKVGVVLCRGNCMSNIGPDARYSFMRQSLIPTRKALSRALAIYRNPGWDLKVLRIEGPYGERMEAGEIDARCERAAASDR